MCFSFSTVLESQKSPEIYRLPALYARQRNLQGFASTWNNFLRGQDLCTLRDAGLGVLAWSWVCGGVLILLAFLYFYSQVTAYIISCHVTLAKNVNGQLVGRTDGITSFMVLSFF